MRLRIGLALAVAAALFAASPYQAEIVQWHKDREAGLKAEDGWLSLAGLVWLHDGANTFGTGKKVDVELPDGPANGGVFTLQGGKVTVTMGGATREVHANGNDIVKVGRLHLFVIKRGDKYGIRVKDPESQARREFKGIEYFPIDESYRVVAKWVPEAKKIPILNVLGQTDLDESPGYASFQLKGRNFTLRPILETPDAKELFYIIADETTGKETYHGGRFLYSEMPKDGKVVLDFNKAYNPPCVFTPFATCPLPPKENRLALRLEAGEKRYGH